MSYSGSLGCHCRVKDRTGKGVSGVKWMLVRMRGTCVKITVSNGEVGHTR